MTNFEIDSPLRQQFELICSARHHDPFAVLGRHQQDKICSVRFYNPHASSARILPLDEPMLSTDMEGVFIWQGPAQKLPANYQIQWQHIEGHQIVQHDPYAFDAQISEFDLHLFGEGKHWHAYQFLGANRRVIGDIEGVLFATWAPNASRVSVVGDFNQWDGRRHPMRNRGSSGVWELFIPGCQAGDLYKFEIRNRDTGLAVSKTDPYGKAFELRPKSACYVNTSDYVWQDQQWQRAREQANWLHQPLSIYELHLGSWHRNEHGGFLNYRELAERLVPYIKELGFTHIELLPITEHPLDASWGYQALGYFAPTSRFGSPDDFRYFVDLCHQNNIGVILDWVPAHFPSDSHGLARFDGTALYEHDDPRKGFHRDWGTLIYNYSRPEVKNFLLSSAFYWLEEFHLDGLRVDAVASMLYLDYSRDPNDWIPNQYGGRENLEAIDFLREMNSVTHAEHPGTLIMAEESTAWPGVSRPVYTGGLGFSTKWNMGWMHDTLDYMQHDPVHRHFHHNQLTFGLLYSFTENFILPFSHDEVVHGKGSLRSKMPGDEWQQFANLRLLYTYMFTYPGKKLLFMGCEFGQGPEWNHQHSLDWYVLQYPHHQGLKQLVSDLNYHYRQQPALHHFDFDHRGFQWINCNDASQSVLSYIRQDESGFVIVVLNFTPVVRHHYRIGVPRGGNYCELLNSDGHAYGGSNQGNGGQLTAENHACMGFDHSLSLTLPPLGGMILKPI
ncbi:MAG: 1,4-alpha-glucan branching protein GlgB [Gammaproteobacteria bacterium]|nr:1,4-alpha-glucan branching protein GlgB [Gammaproteobacteria bacterium]